MRKADYIHKEYPKTCEEDDFWGQIKRTVDGKPVSQEQIDLIVDAVRKGLSLREEDCLLDIGCGNGALSRYFFTECSQFLGVDFSDYLISVAKKNFERSASHTFRILDAASYVDKETKPKRFSKALCYGCFPYFTFEEAEHILLTLSERFTNLDKFYIGNLPDKDRAHLFHRKNDGAEPLLTDNTSAIGIWRSKDEMKRLAEKCRWAVEFVVMPRSFYAAHYRFDAILTRDSQSGEEKTYL